MISKEDVERKFRDEAATAIAAHGTTALAAMKRSPGACKMVVAQLHGAGITPRGLTALLFEEAREASAIRELSRDLLFRKLRSEFPGGWNDAEKVRPFVKLSGWLFDIVDFAPEYGEIARSILKRLAIDNTPPTGWVPTGPDDERVEELFKTFWLADHART